MTTSEIDIKIGCNEEAQQQNYRHFNLSMSLQQSKLNQFNKNIQKCLNIKKTPLLTIQFSATQFVSVPTLTFFDSQYEIHHKIVGSKSILYGDINNPDKMLFIKKIQRIFHLLTQLDVSLNLKFDILDIDKKISMQQPSELSLTQGLKIKGKLKMDEKGGQILKKCLIKVSPKFLQSPIFVLFDLLVSMDFKLNLQSLSFLEQECRKSIIKDKINQNQNNKKLFQILKKKGDETVNITFCIQKLAVFQIHGPACVVAVACLFL